MVEGEKIMRYDHVIVDQFYGNRSEAFRGAMDLQMAIVEGGLEGEDLGKIAEEWYRTLQATIEGD